MGKIIFFLNGGFTLKNMKLVSKKNTQLKSKLFNEFTAQGDSKSPLQIGK